MQSSTRYFVRAYAWKRTLLDLILEARANPCHHNSIRPSVETWFFAQTTTQQTPKTEKATMTIEAAPLSPEAKKRMIASYVGYLSVICFFVKPKETFVSVASAMKLMEFVYASFFGLFAGMPAKFFSENFAKEPKDNFGELFMVMFGFQGLFQLYLIRQMDMYLVFPFLCAFNAAMCYVGPQRGEKLMAPNVLPNHIVPHAGLCLCTLAALSTLI